MKKLIVIGCLALVGCSSNYSDGNRVGIVRKFSKKGVLIKSWEGELLLGGVVSNGDSKNPALVNEIFEFSVDPNASHGENVDKVVEEINQAMDSGKRTKLHYVQDTWPKLRANTEYFIQKAEIVEK